MKHLKYLNKYFFKYKYYVLGGVFFIFLSNLFRIYSPRVVRNAIDLVTENIVFYSLFNQSFLQESLAKSLFTGLLFFAIIYFVLAILQGVFMFFMRQTIIVMSRKIEYELREEIYAHYQSLDVAFYKRNNTGDLMSRITEDVGRVRMYLGPALMYAVNLGMLMIMAIASMLMVNSYLTMFVLIPLPFLSVSIYYVNSRINKASERIQAKLSHLTTFAQEMYAGIRVVKAYVREKRFLYLFDKESEEYKTNSLELARIEGLFFPLMILLTGISTIIAIYVGGLEVLRGNITPGNIAEFVIYVNMLTWPVTAIGWVASIIQRASASQQRINEFLTTKPAIINRVKDDIKLKGHIEFKDVVFVYPDTGISALNGINFKIKQGERWAIIGKTGSGKTTIAELILRMYDTTEGSVLVDDKDVRRLNLNSLRAQIGYVPQDVFLFSDDIYNNISFGIPSMENNQIEEAAKKASIHPEITELSEGFNTVVGERGVTLSGGQKQRVSIARAFVREPSVLILDDCLSAVDAKTEKNILLRLDEVMQGRTSILITHRIFSLLNFDNILVLKDGKIGEQGTHEELMKLNGDYRDLYELQQIEELVANSEGL